MNLRIFLLKPKEEIRHSLVSYIESLGHEVAVIQYPQSCLQSNFENRTCSPTQFCADAIILGGDIPNAEGFDLLEKRLLSGCKGTEYSAVISDTLTELELKRAEKVGCKVLAEPLHMDEVGVWLKDLVEKVNPERKLSPYTVGGRV